MGSNNLGAFLYGFGGNVGSKKTFLHPPVFKLINDFLVAEELREHFGAYGEIESINVKTDPNTGRSRGFAFIVFKAAEAIEKVCNCLLPFKINTSSSIFCLLLLAANIL